MSSESSVGNGAGWHVVFIVVALVFGAATFGTLYDDGDPARGGVFLVVSLLAAYLAPIPEALGEDEEALTHTHEWVALNRVPVSKEWDLPVLGHRSQHYVAVLEECEYCKKNRVYAVRDDGKREDLDMDFAVVEFPPLFRDADVTGTPFGGKHHG